jgi:hypothetical protein
MSYYADYKTAAGGVPSAPSNLQVVINDKPTSEVDFADVITSTNKVKLNWSPSSGNVSGYKVYVAKSGSVLNYVPLESDSSTSNSTANNYFTSDISKIIKALYGSGVKVDPISTQNYPFVNNTVYFKVVAYNGDGESSGEAVSVKDAVGPQRTGPNAAYSANSAAFRGATLSNGYYLPKIAASDVGIAYVFLNQPVDPTTVSGNIEISGVTLTASLLTQSSDDLGEWVGLSDYAVIKIDAGSTDIRGKTVTLKTGLKDLSGNAVVSGIGDTITLP